MRLSRKQKRFTLWAIICLPVVWAVSLAVLISLAGRLNPDARGDVAIVLGAAVWDDEPSPVFAARIDHAVDLWEYGQVDRIIFTGGLAEGDSLAESEAASAYAQSQGVPASAILIETESTSTIENLRFAQSVMERSNLERAVLVSDPHHMRRAHLMANRLGIEHELSPTPTSRYKSLGKKTEQLFREMYFTTQFVLAGR